MSLEKVTANRMSEQDRLNMISRLRNRPRYSRTKLIKAGTGSAATIAIAPEVIDISAPANENGDPTGISVIAGKGVVIRGPVGFTENPSSIKIAGMWRLNDLLLSSAPSTLLTPIPVLIFSPPLASVGEFIKSTAAIAAITGGL